MTPIVSPTSPRRGGITTASRLPASLLLAPVSRRPTQLAPETIATLMANELHRAVPARLRQAPATATPVVSIVVVTANNLVFLKLCVVSILANTRQPSYELVVVDNGSTDGTGQYLDELAQRHRHV